MENQKKLNEIFRNLNKSLIETANSSFLDLFEKALHDLSGFEKACLHAKIQLLKLFIEHAPSLNDEQLKQIGSKIKLLSSSNDYLLEEGLINIYIQIYDKNKKNSKKESKVVNLLNFHVQNYIDELIKFFFFENELKHFRKYKNHFKDLAHENLQGLNDAMQTKIKQRIWSKKSSQLFKYYLKSQQANKNKQLCRICYKKFELTTLARHVQNCGKKTYIKQQLTSNFQKRIQIVKNLQIISFERTQEDKDFNIILKIIQFYKNLKNDTKNRRRMSLRYQDAKMPLFFYECQINLENQKIQTKLLSQLSTLQNRAFYLDKKLNQLQQIQSGISTGQENLKLSMNSSLAYKNGLKKFNSVSSQYKKLQIKSKIPLDSNSSISSYASQQSNQSHQDKQNKDNESPEKQSNNQKENQPQANINPPIIVRRLKKKFTEFHGGCLSQKSQSNASEVNYGSLSIKNFQILKLLGKGAFGRVYLVRRNKTEDIYALKVIKIEKYWGQTELQSIKNQYGVYKQIAGDHLVTATFSFQQKNAQFFVLEYMPGGDFSNLLQQNIYLQEKDAQFYLAQIILAIEHLHSSGIIHRDLKPQNIILDAKGHIKLTDFGLSQFRVKQKIGKILHNQKIETKQYQNLRISMKKKSLIKGKNGIKLIGTPDYIAPQIIQGTSLINPSIDWWSLGVIAYEMLIGCRPFCANTVQQILMNIESGQIEWPEIGQQENMISPVAADLIKRFLNRNFQQRLGYNGVEQIKNHPFFRGVDWQNLKNTKPPALGQGIKIEEIDFLSQDNQLRKQIQTLIKHEQQETNRLEQLKNYVRYDLLTAQTLQSVRVGTDKKQRRIQKLKSITTNLQTRDPQWAKYKAEAQQLSKKHNNSQVYIHI